MKKIINNIEYDLTEEDLIQKELDFIKSEEDRISREQLLTEQETKRKAAIDKLSLLGLTEDDIKAILNIK